MTLIVPIVGAHFRPPAKWVLARLPNGAQLRLEAEPGNPYDPNAIKVFGEIIDVPESEHEALEVEIAGAGFDLAEMIASGQSIWLGYIGDSQGKLCAKNDWLGNAEVHAVAKRRNLDMDELRARLASLASGQPAASIEES